MAVGWSCQLALVLPQFPAFLPNWSSPDVSWQFFSSTFQYLESTRAALELQSKVREVASLQTYEIARAHARSQSRFLTPLPSFLPRRGKHGDTHSAGNRPLAMNWSRMASIGMQVFDQVIKQSLQTYHPPSLDSVWVFQIGRMALGSTE